MPEPAEFLHGFGLHEQKIYNGYILENAYATHKSIKRYQEYYYNIQLVFKNLGTGNYNDLYNTIQQITKESHIIYGVRNPYKCIIDPPKDITTDNNGNVIFNLIGHSYRV